MTDSANPQAGFIGLGAMGRPMAAHLAANGLLAAVWNRSDDKARAFAAEYDVMVCTSPAELAQRCQVIFTCVSADRDLQTISDDLLAGVSAGKILVDTSTVSPETALAVDAAWATRQADFIDAPVSGGVEGARKGSLSVMAGGSDAAMQVALPFIQAFSSQVVHMGGVGAGQRTKAVNQVMVAGIAQAVCEALALAERLELPQQRLLDVLKAGAAGSWFLEHRGQTMLNDEFDVGFKQSLLFKDLKICEGIARELDGDLPLVSASVTDFGALVADGDGDNDISGLIKLKRRRLAGAD